MPLIIAGPGINKNEKIMDTPVELIDIYPTLMDILNFETPKFVSGKFFSTIENSKAKVRRAH